MKRGRVDSDTFILQSDARIHDLDRELEILRQKRQIIQEQMTQKPYGVPFMPEPPRQPWNQQYQEPQHMVQYPIMSQIKPLMNPQRMNQNLGQHASASHYNQTSQFNQNPPRRAPNQPRRPPIQMGRQKSPPRRPNNPPRRVNNPPPRPNNPSMRPPRPTYPTSRPNNPPRRPINPPQRPANPPQRPANPPQRPANPPQRPANAPQRPANPPVDTNDFKRAKQRKRPRKLNDGQVTSFKPETVKPAYESYKPGLMFRENEEPSNQVMGRLELALGTILKSIRLEYGRPPHNIIFTTEGMKHLKAEIRRRVRLAMDGKLLGTINDTMDEYRKMFPLNTDKEMVDSMKKHQEAQLAVNKPSVAEESFRKHIKDNFKTTMDEFVTEMITKMKTICAQEEGRVRSELELIEAERETEGEGDAIEASGPSQPTDDQSAAVADESQWQTDVDIEQPKGDVDIDQPKGDVKVERPNKMLDSCHPFAKMAYYLISRKLPDVLGKHKEIIASFIDEEKLFNKLYERKRKQVIVERKERLKAPLYLKVLGHPTLPPKKDTVLFLKNFNIVSLKKHTKLTNMLVAAVFTQQDYEAMMAANGITLGNSTLYIQRSKSRTDDSCDFGDEPTNGDDPPTKSKTLKALDHIDEQIENLLTDIRNNDDADECTNAKKFKKGDGKAIDSADVFGVNKHDSDHALVIDDANDPETVTADSTNIDGEVDGLPTGFEVIDSIHDNRDETPQENDSQVTVDNPSYSNATTLEIGEELKDVSEVDVLIENNIEVSNNSQSDVEIVEGVQDVITIDDDVEKSVSSETEDVDVKPVVVADVISEPRRSSRNVTKN